MIIEKPNVQVDNYAGDTGKEKSRFISPRGFRFTSTTTNEKVKDAISRNAILESSPNRRSLTMETSERIMNLRPREERKELSRAFRF